MDQALRKTGIPLIEEIPWGSHIALFYETSCDLLDTSAAYFRAGLQSNEFCTWAIADWVPVEAARRALRDNVPDFDRYESNGSFELVTACEPELHGGAFDVQCIVRRWHAKLRHAMERGYEGVRASSNAWLAMSQAGRYFELERRLADALEGRPMLAMATYDLKVSSAVDVLDVVRAHDFAIARRPGDWQLMETLESKQADTGVRKINDVSDAIPTPFPGRELLTDRERAVLAQIVNGASSKEVARDLGVSPRTVDFHRSNILQKLGARNIAELVRVVLSRE